MRSIADFVVLGVSPHYSHIESECPRVEGDEGTAQQPNLETVDKYYVHAWMLLNKSRSPGFVEVDNRHWRVYSYPSHHTAVEMACWGEGTAEHRCMTPTCSS
eukprot:scaffold148121_cov35-Attheya_sp.AAC.1